MFHRNLIAMETGGVLRATLRDNVVAVAPPGLEVECTGCKIATPHSPPRKLLRPEGGL